MLTSCSKLRKLFNRDFKIHHHNHHNHHRSSLGIHTGLATRLSWGAKPLHKTWLTQSSAWRQLGVGMARGMPWWEQFISDLNLSNFPRCRKVALSCCPKRLAEPTFRPNLIKKQEKKVRNVNKNKSWNDKIRCSRSGVPVVALPFLECWRCFITLCGSDKWCFPYLGTNLFLIQCFHKLWIWVTESLFSWLQVHEAKQSDDAGCSNHDSF